MDISARKVWVRPNVVCEPLVNRWYAWPYLIPPATASLYVANHHLQVMQRFVTAPQVHVEALKNPEMVGGPFINYGASDVGSIRALMERTRKEQFHLLELADALKRLSELLTAEGTGASLEPLYAKVPEQLRGMVELLYDLQHRPYFRIIEPLVYRSKLYQDSNQSLALSLRNDDARPFALSTPRIDQAGVQFVDKPFASDAVDVLSRGRREGVVFGRLQEALGLSSEQLSPFVSEDAPQLRRDPGASGPRVRYFGHACILVESEGTSVLFDPLLGYKFAGASPRYGFDDLPDEIDYAVITHSHQDHALFETLLQLRHRIKTLVVPRNMQGNLADPSLKLVLEAIGFKSVRCIDELETIEIPGGSLTALPFLGEHGDLDVLTKAAHLLRLGGKTLLCAADSNNIEPRLYERLRDFVGPLDALFLGMECQGAPLTWLYGPLLTRPILRKNDQTRRLDGSDCDRALNIVEQLAPKAAYVYAMGAEPWLNFISSIHYTAESKPIVESDKFVNECRKRGIASERLHGCKEIPLTG
jgi:L-ascorbate metabolism protein UlaG (beta-lactamase superfamily)